MRANRAMSLGHDARVRSEAEAHGIWQLEPPTPRREASGRLLPRKDDDRARLLIRGDEPMPRRVQAEVAWPVAFRADALLQSEGARRRRDREDRDAIVPTI